MVDDSLRIIVANQSEFPETAEATSLFVNCGQTFQFYEVPSELDQGIGYHVHSLGETYILYFSSIPILSIQTEEEITEDLLVLGDLSLSAMSQFTISSFAGIKTRGGLSQNYEKKSFRFELWSDNLGQVKNDIPLAGLRNDDDWILVPMSNEPLRIRNKIGHELWSEIHYPYYQEHEPGASSTVSSRYIDLFINDRYQGIYLLMERVDRKLLQLRDFERQQTGELYKGVTWGASQYYYCPAYSNNSRYWSGFEMQYPKEEDQTDWGNLYSTVNLVVNETDQVFNQDVFHDFNINNVIDYFLFVNLLRASDNLGKNVYVAKYDQGEPYFFVPWDLDGILGTEYGGQQDTVFDDILTNGLFDRLILNDSTYFLNHTAYRWYQLREAEFSNGALEQRLYSQIEFLNESGAYNRESIAWPEFTFQSTDKDYMVSWITDRLVFLDDYFSAFVGIPEQETSINIYPNPTSGKIWVESATGSTQLKLFNSNGQMLIEKSLDNGTNQINLDELESGLYHIVMIGNDDVTSQSLIIAR